MPPANDNVASRRVITGASGTDGPIVIDTATTEASEPHGSFVTNNIHQSIWYEWTPSVSESVVFDTTGSPATDGNADTFGHLDTTLAVWTASNPASFATYVGVASNDDNPDGPAGSFTSKVSFLAFAGTTYLIQVGTWAAGYHGSVILNWTAVAAVTSSDCLTTTTNIVSDITGSLTPGTATGDDFTAPHDSGIFGGNFYGCWELDVGAPNTGPYYQYWVGSCDLTGSGFTSTELNGFGTHDLHDAAAADIGGVGTIPGGTVHSAGGGAFGASTHAGGRMRLVYDGTDVFVVAVNTLIVRNPNDADPTDALADYNPAGEANAIRYELRVYREDSGAWTEIAVIQTVPSVALDGFNGYRVCCSDAEPGVLYIGIMYVQHQLIKLSDGSKPAAGNLLYDRFERWSVDTATGATTLFSSASSSEQQADFLANVTFASVGTLVWDLVNDDGFPILLRNKASTIDPAASPIRTGYDTFVTVERFDTAAAITTFDYLDVSGIAGSYPIAIDSEEFRESVTLRVYPRFYCTETSSYKRYVSTQWDTTTSTFLHRVASDFSGAPELIAPETAMSNSTTWAGHSSPLYDGLRNVWQHAGAGAEGGENHMWHFDRRCDHIWVEADVSTLVTQFQYGGWSGDSFYSLGFVNHGSAWPIIKLGPITRDCVFCEGGPFASGLFAWQRF